MAKQYVKIKSIYKKLSEADKKGQIIYLAGQVCTGKTAAINYYYRNRKVLYLSGQSGYLDQMPSFDEIKEDTVVIDDISWITDETSKRYIKNLVSEGVKHVVLAGRSRIPKWLKIESIDYNFASIAPKEFLINSEETLELLKNSGVDVSKEVAEAIWNDTKGYVLGIQMIAYRMGNSEGYSKSLLEESRVDMYRHLDENLYNIWNVDMREMLMKISAFKEFDIEMVKLITGKANSAQLIEEASSIGSFIYINNNQKYQILDMLVKYFAWKRSQVLSEDEITEIYNRAGLYFELEDQIENALVYYDKANNENKISELLIVNSDRQPGTAHFFETRKYYQELPEELILKSPTLMAGCSMMYSILMDTEKSNYWFEKLNEMEKKFPKGSSEKKEAWTRIAYLEIALPQLGSLTIAKFLKDIAIMCMNRNIMLPEFSVTSNLPSTMNGGKDFCEWSKKDRELADTLKKPIEFVLGKTGAGLVNIALGESLFEKGSDDLYEIITLLNSGYQIANIKGKIEMCFAAVGALCKIHISQGQMSIAISQLRQFKDRVENEGAKQLVKNIDAMEVWIALHKSDTDMVKEWLKNTPIETEAFNTLDRYGYMMKIRAYISLDRMTEAIYLIERMNVYVEEYYRTYMKIEIYTLKAIAQYRVEYENWSESMGKAIAIAQEYHFVNAISQEGAAVKELVDKMDLSEYSEEYIKDIKKEVNSIAKYYPAYLKNNNEKPSLTSMEQEILQDLCDGKALNQIGEEKSISYSTVKFHCRNIYRKINVKNRQEAQAKAKELGFY